MTLPPAEPAPSPKRQTKPRRPSRRLDWASLHQHTFGVDVLRCPSCGGRRRLHAIHSTRKAAEERLLQLGHRLAPRASTPPPSSHRPALLVSGGLTLTSDSPAPATHGHGSDLSPSRGCAAPPPRPRRTPAPLPERLDPPPRFPLSSSSPSTIAVITTIATGTHRRLKLAKVAARYAVAPSAPRPVTALAKSTPKRLSSTSPIRSAASR